MSEAAQPRARRARRSGRSSLPWVVTAVCFYFLWRRVEGTAARQGQDVTTYMRQVVDAGALGAVARADDPLLAALPGDRHARWSGARSTGSTRRCATSTSCRSARPRYIISILNEQVGKGAIALYMNRRHGIPGWEIGSSMLFIMFCEIYSLLSWATLGYFMARDALPAEFDLIPWVARAARSSCSSLMTAFFAGQLGVGAALRERAIFRAFRLARPLALPRDRAAARAVDPGRGRGLHRGGSPVRDRRSACARCWATCRWSSSAPRSRRRCARSRSRSGSCCSRATPGRPRSSASSSTTSSCSSTRRSGWSSCAAPTASCWTAR